QGRPRVTLLGYDITDLQAAQQRAVQMERLAAIGQTAAGLAHEARNALQRIQSCLSILGLRLQDQPDCQNILARAQKGQDDLSRLFNEVRDYAAPLRLDLQPCDLADVWREAWADLGPPA